ncbi:MAG: pimeloyl-ACP methyl ester carboxylesterase [Parasphingorhabdus sp.]|jgi:pimeloyl-ACP methyl ester carboxylesterase
MARAKLHNGVELEYETFGDPKNPVIFIILGITDNITDWPAGLYQPLVDAGFCVVRYELRDMGLSSKFEQAGKADLVAAKSSVEQGILPEAPYTVHEVTEDAKLLMDYLNIRSACVVGYSYGSMVAQLLSLQAPDKVSGLVCLQGSNYNPTLPARTPEVEKAMLGATFEYETYEEQVRAIFNLRKATNGSIHFLDDDEAMHSARTSVDRTYYPEGTARIVLSRFATAPFFQNVSNIACPTLVLHGDEDPIFSLPHGKDIADRIPGAELVILEGAGHNHPLSLQPVISQHIVEFAGRVFH